MQKPDFSKLTLKQWANIAEIVAAVVIIFSLLYVGFEIRQNTVALQQSSYQNAMDRLAASDLELATNEELLRIVMKAETAGPLTAMEQRRFEHFVVPKFGEWENLFLARENDALSDRHWGAANAYFAGMMCYPGYQQVWSGNKPSFTAEFIAHVEAVPDCSIDAPAPPEVVAYTNATWWDGETAFSGSMLVDDGVFVNVADAEVDRTVDLGGAFVTPPFGEGHNHNLMEKLFDDANAAYFEQGVFYVKVPTIYPPAIESVKPKLARPDTVDALFSMGGLTNPGGHPVPLFVDVLSGSVYDELDYEDFAGQAFHEVESGAEIRQALDALEAQGADFVKLLLMYAEDYGRGKGDDNRGLSPELVTMIVSEAKARGLPVTAHVQSAFDFSAAVDANVDEVAHLPGYGWPEGYDSYRHKITDQEARAAARAGIAVVTTTSFPMGRLPEPERLQLMLDAQISNLQKLERAGVELRIGSDIYDRAGTGADRHATRSEVLNLVDLGVMNAESAIATWIATGSAIFPQRRLGCFEAGCEASFLVFDRDPRTDLAALSDIQLAVKQGVDVTPGAE